MPLLALSVIVSIVAQFAVALPRQELVCRFSGRVMSVCCCPGAASDERTFEKRCCCDVVQIGAASMPAIPEQSPWRAPPALPAVGACNDRPASVATPTLIVDLAFLRALERGPPSMPVYLRARHLLV